MYLAKYYIPKFEAKTELKAKISSQDWCCKMITITVL